MARILYICVLLSCLSLFAETEPIESEPSLDYPQAVFLGVVEGFTEFLPVSSTGHLILANDFIHPSDLPADQSESFKNALDAYSIIIQLGAIAAVFLIYFRRIFSVLWGLMGQDPTGLRLGINLMVAFLPAAIIGLLLHDWIETLLFHPTPVAAALFFGALLMIWAERSTKKKSLMGGKDLSSLSPLQALVIGFWQCLALWPGTSRSMVTIVGGYRAGLAPAQAAEFSFLLGFITLSAASLYKIVSSGATVIQSIPPGPMITGLFVAGLSAALSVKWLVSFLNRRGLLPFAIYRIVLAVGILLWAA